MLFNDRRDAGRQLAAKLKKYDKQSDAVVIGLARGGVPVAFEVAAALHLPLTTIVIRKIGAPQNEELALGAIAETGEGIYNDHLISLLGVSPDYLKREGEKQKKIAQGRSSLYKGSSPPIDLQGKIALIIDDGIATGASIRVAIKAIRAQGVAKIVLAVPVAASDSLRLIEKEVDATVCLSTPASFGAVGAFYRLFDQTTDEELIQLLEQAKKL